MPGGRDAGGGRPRGASETGGGKGGPVSGTIKTASGAASETTGDPTRAAPPSREDNTAPTAGAKEAVQLAPAASSMVLCTPVPRLTAAAEVRPGLSWGSSSGSTTGSSNLGFHPGLSPAQPVSCLRDTSTEMVPEVRASGCQIRGAVSKVLAKLARTPYRCHHN